MTGRRHTVRAAALLAATALLAACTSDLSAAPTPSAVPSPDACAGQPTSPSAMSAKTLKRISRAPTGAQPVTDPPAGIRPLAEVGSPPWTNCETRRLTSWEIALARVWLLDRCPPGKHGSCRSRYLAYVEVRRFFGDGPPPHCCVGAPQPIPKNVTFTVTNYIDPRTGKTFRGTVR